MKNQLRDSNNRFVSPLSHIEKAEVIWRKLEQVAKHFTSEEIINLINQIEDPAQKLVLIGNFTKLANDIKISNKKVKLDKAKLKLLKDKEKKEEVDTKIEIIYSKKKKEI